MRPTEAVLLDANVIVRDRWLASAEWGILVREARDGICEIHVPEVVVREVVGHHRRELQRCRAAALAAENDARRLRAVLTVDMDVEAEVEVFEEHLRQALDEARVVVLEPPPIDLLQLVDQAALRRRPFDDRGNGFRDAIIWEHAIALLPINLTLITDDDDFRRDGSLAPELQADLQERATGDWVFDLRSSLADYVKNRRTAKPDLLSEVRSAVVEQEPALLSEVGSLLERANVATGGLNDVDVQIIEASTPFDLVLNDAYADDEDDSLVYVEMTAFAEVELEVYLWRGQHVPVSEVAEIDLTATFDRSSGRISDMTVHPIDVELDVHLEAAGISVG